VTTEANEAEEPVVAEATLARFRACPTATICDAYIKSGIRRPESVFMEGLRPLQHDDRIIVGRARTKLLTIVRDPERSSLVSNRELAFEHVDGAAPGDFLVIAAPRAQPYAIWGGHLTLQSGLRGAVGVVADGATRDASEIAKRSFPVWCRGVTPIPSGYGGYSAIATNVAVTCGGVEVIPGDYIVADQDGVVVVPQEDAEQLLEICEEMERAEETARINIENGSSMLDSYVSRSYYAKSGSHGD
jgi:regulator of RNase E activity RraA